MYQYLIFDLDDTLFDFQGGEQANLTELFADWHLSPAALADTLASYHQINQGLWADYAAGRIQRDDIFARRFPATLAAQHLSGDAAALEARYHELLLSNYRLLPAATETLVNLKAAGFTLIAGTNGQAPMQHRRLDKTGLGQYFDQVYISDEIGFAKPDRRFYEPIFAANPGMNKQNALMIGDSLFSDIAGGQAAGIDTYWLQAEPTQRTPEPEPTYQGKDLKALQQFLLSD
ncbi:YjjG family noncanonical pyrimidine nucleotidase [Leuconostocaceae bacterium ESL0958]|nr:YjjG family noncanonical pyrimidine nucleotidase [Leuconostocaceae bacterium ESL0958]